VGRFFTGFKDKGLLGLPTCMNQHSRVGEGGFFEEFRV